MADVATTEGIKNPKEQLKKLTTQRRKELTAEEGTEAKATKKAGPVKSKATLKLTGDKVEISTEVVKKSAGKRAASASAAKKQ